jgi:hypothetical protein
MLARSGLTGRVVWCASVLGVVMSAQAQQNIAPDSWKPVDQPDIARVLSSAEPLAFETLADGPDSAWVGPEWFVPHPDGKSWSVVLFYYPQYMGPHQVYMHNFATGQTNAIRFPDVEGQRIGVHLRPIFHLHDRLKMVPGGSAITVLDYDPVANEMTFHGLPLGDAVQGNGSVAANDDGSKFYGIGQTRGERTVAFFVLDTQTNEGRVVANVGPDNPNMAWDYHKIAADGDWAYGAVGNRPWRLWGVNMKTGENKLIAETEIFASNHRTVQIRQLADYPGVEVSITGLKGSDETTVQQFWLRDGELSPRTGDVPPWADERFASPRSTFRLPHERRTPDGIERFRMPVDRAGKVRYWYRLNDEQAQIAGKEPNRWHKLDLEVDTYPARIRRMTVLPDNTIFALTEGYGRAVKFNPATGERTTLGPTMSVYSMTSHDGKVYMCGYPSSQVWVYDPAEPWTVGDSSDAPPTEQMSPDDVQATPQSNPANVARLMQYTRVHMPYGGAVPGADGRIYFGGNIIRIGNGGGLGWWDTRSNEGGGFYEPFSAYQIFWMCSAADSRYIVISTKPVEDDNQPGYRPERGRLFVYDTQSHEITQQVDGDFWKVPGYVVEALPGLVIGYATTDNEDGGVLYGFDPSSGKILWNKPGLPRPSTGFSAIRRWNYAFTKGPDGFIWATMNGTLARIDPQTVEVHPVGRMSDAQIVFVNGDVYVAGDGTFRRIRGLPPVGAGR